jgi:putative lipoprotein
VLHRLLGLATTVSALACTARPPGPAVEAPPGGLAGPSPFSTVYACADSVRFSTRPSGERLVLTLPERSDTLARVEAASGAQYSSGGLVFRSQGDAARLEGGGRTHTDCRGRRAGDPWEEAAWMGVAFRALGQEPGWVLDLAPGRWIRYVGDYGSTRFFGLSPREIHGAEGRGAGSATVYDAESGGHRLQVELREEPCRDAMSDERFSHAVTVRFDVDTVEGCGRMTPPGELTNKYWKLTELDGQPVVAGAGREPHLRFQAADSHVAGSTGCNSLSGSFTRDGDHLSFASMVTTLMACADTALAGQEQRMTAALASVDRWAAVGDRLTLYAKERPVARFVAVYFQ